MAIRQYIGARYVPRFTGAYDATQIYEALDVVDNGAGTSYIARKTVPAGTPLTNTDYWFVYGASSGAIISLQTRMDAAETAINNIPTNRKYIVIGDSFGYGIKGDGSTWTTGWIDYLKAMLPNNIFCYETSDPTFEGTAAFLGTRPWIDLFDWIINNKLGTTNASEITNVVILGGNNEPNDSEAALTAYIKDVFIPHVKSICINADISIGCIGLDSNLLISKAAKAYSKACREGGANYISDTLNLGCIPSYDSGHGHWTNAGYAFYNPFIAHAALFGHVEYSWSLIYPLTVNSDITYQGSVTFSLAVLVSNKDVRYRLFTSIGYSGWRLVYNKPWSGGTASAKAFTIDANIYFPFSNGSSVAPSFIIDLPTQGVIGSSNAQILKDNTGYFIRFSGFITGLVTGDLNTNIAFIWDGSALHTQQNTIVNNA